MGAWADIKRTARENVHETFSLSAQHTNVRTNIASPVSVRLHNKLATIGDLDREGYSQEVAEVDRLIFLKSEVDTYDVRQKDRVVLDDGRVFHLDLREPVRDLYTTEFRVSPVSL